MKYLRILCLLAFTVVLSGLFYSCDDNQQATNPTIKAITGKFLDKDGIPVEGVTVEAIDANGNVFSTDVTDANGFFKIQNVPTELTNGIVSFVSAGEIIHQEKLETVVNSNSKSGKGGNVFQSGENDFEAVFKLTIKDTETELPVSGADVRLATSQNAAFSKISDAAGGVFFENIAPGKYKLRVTAADYNTYEEAFVLLFPEGADTLRYTIYLDKKLNNGDSTGHDPNWNDTCCTNSVRFYIYDAETKQKMTNAIANIMAVYGKYYQESCNYGGFVHFDSLCVGDHIVTVKAPGYNPQQFRVKIECGDNNKELEPVYLTKEQEKDPCKCGVTVWVWDSTLNKGIANAKVKLIQANSIAKELKTNSGGYANFGNVCEGNYQLSVSTDFGNKQIPITVNCANGDSAFFKVYFGSKPEEDCKGSIKLTVIGDIDSLNLPPDTLYTIFAGAKVKLYDAKTKQKLAELTSDVNGVVKFDNLPQGHYTIDVIYYDANGVFYKGYSSVFLKCDEHYKGNVYVRKE